MILACAEVDGKLDIDFGRVTAEFKSSLAAGLLGSLRLQPEVLGRKE